MKKILIILIALIFFACKKNRTCECTNANGTYIGGEIEATKFKAKKVCKALNNATTTCKLK
jgi:hypothetical protein